MSGMGGAGTPASPPMSEADLLVGLTDALTIGGWTWMHIIRSDGVTQGHSGWFDLIAAHDARPFVLAWELKGERGRISPDQFRWMLALRGAPGVDVRVIYPADYDRALDVILRDRHPSDVWSEG